MMKHFSHLHDLHITPISTQNESQPCFGCNLPLLGTCYSCSSCNFYLHKFCFDHPQSVKFHGVHSEHTLRLLYPPYIHGPCSICVEPCKGFTYNCSLCDYNVHANCASLMDHHETKNDRDQYIAVFLAVKVGEMKTRINGLGSTSSTKNDYKVKEELANIRKMERENELSRMRQEMSDQQARRSLESIERMSDIEFGSSSRYKYTTYRYY